MGISTTVREPVTLVRTKLHRPQVGPELVRRPRLESRLDQSLNGTLILVSAPAGFGKTTLVSQWLDMRGYPAAWLSLTERDSDLEAFLRYVIAAIRTVDADACPSTWALLDAPQLPPVDYLATHLVRELDEVPEDLLLVLDDYSRAQSQSVNELIETLVESMPSTMRLVLITRADPSLPLANLRGSEDAGATRRRPEVHFG